MLIQADAKALEWRVILELSQDPVGIQEVLDGADAHSLNQAAFNLPSRLIAKKYLFRTIFNHGKGYAFTVDPDFMHVSTSVKYWDGVGEKFYKKYEGIEKLYQKNIQLVLDNKNIVGPLGRFWPIKLMHDWKGDLKVPETLVVNYPVQGTSADIMTIARLSFWNRINKHPQFKNIKLISTVHDSIVVDAPSQLLYYIVNELDSVFKDIPKNVKKIFGYDWKVPLGCECKAGPNMKDMTTVVLTAPH